MHSFTNLEVWKSAMALAKEVYRVTKSFPPQEMYGLTSQLRRASTSILANIAEGCGKFTFADKAHKFVIARGECAEVEAYLLFASEVEFMKKQDTASFELLDQTGRMLSGLIKSCHSASKQNSTHKTLITNR